MVTSQQKATTFISPYKSCVLTLCLAQGTLLFMSEPLKVSPLYVYAATVFWAAGVVFSLTPIEAYTAESFLAAGVCLFVSAFLAVVSAEDIDLGSLLRAPVALGVAGFSVLAFISAALSDVPFVSFIFACSFAAFPISFFMFSTCFKPLIKPIGYGLAALIGAMALFAVFQFFALPDWLVFKLVAWPFSNPNSLASLFSLGFFCAIGWMLAAPSRAASNLAMALAILCLWAVFSAGSRAAALAIIFVLPIFLFCLKSFVRAHIKCLGIVVCAGILAFAGFAVFGDNAPGVSPAAILVDTLQGGQSLPSQRLEIWAAGLDMFKDHFWSGTGKGTFFLYYPEYRDGDVETAGFMAHNDPLQFAVEMGALAPILFYSLLALVFLRTLSVVRGLSLEDPKRIAILAPFFALFAMALHAHVTFPFHSVPLLILSGALLGFWFLQTGGFERKQGLPKTANMAFRVISGIVLIGLGFWFARFQASEILVSRAQKSMDQGQLEAFAAQVNMAGDLSYGLNARALSEAASVPVGVMQFNGPLMDDAEQREVYLQAMGLLDKAEAANPRLVNTFFLRGELKSYGEKLVPEALKGMSAKEELARALEIDPMHIRSRLLLSDLYKREGDPEKALAVLKEGLKWNYKTQSPRFYYEKTERLARELGHDVSPPSE